MLPWEMAETYFLASVKYIPTVDNTDTGDIFPDNSAINSMAQFFLVDNSMYMGALLQNN